jgi:hypothetical protein
MHRSQMNQASHRGRKSSRSRTVVRHPIGSTRPTFQALDSQWTAALLAVISTLAGASLPPFGRLSNNG